ncbi:DUF455-domain-containing protein [Scenedesmus sp. NREL 46B-D3]|nr:DUF455-domain-containing protein [Scenedesmus sp. NREL 46B-D3]
MQVKLVAPRDMPKLGKGGTLASRQALLHSLAHIENWAVDLSWDIIARFGSDPTYELPRAFFDDFVQVAADECSHFCSLAKRLEAIGSSYGALPAHDGLWESASTTAHSLPARLAVEHCVHEARGLDVLPGTVAKFRGNGDEETAALLWDVIYAEEISHCAAGVRWLRHLHKVATSQQPASAAADDGWAADARKYDSVEAWFHSLIRSHFKGSLKPPFNDAARKMAGFGPEWYMPLSTGAAAAAAAKAAEAGSTAEQPQPQPQPQQ